MPTESPESPPWHREIPLAFRLMLVAGFLYLSLPLCVWMAGVVLESSGFLGWYYGAGQVALARATDATDPAVTVMRVRLDLWAHLAAVPFWAASVAALLRWLPLVATADIGLTLRGAGRNALLGVAAWIVLTPLVEGLNVAAGWFFQVVVHSPVQEHPFAYACHHGGLSVVEWVLLAFVVMVSAPLWEELVYRGALQRLLLEHPWGPHLGVAAALFAALGRQQPPTPAADAIDVLTASMPVLFVLALAPVYGVVCLVSKTTRPPAVFATALVFAAGHSFAWPTPIALLGLGLGLGYLAVRTRSLIGPVVVHSLFNGTSYVLLLAGWGA